MMDCTTCALRGKCKPKKIIYCSRWTTFFLYIIRNRRTRCYMIEGGGWTTEVKAATHFIMEEANKLITRDNEVFKDVELARGNRFIGHENTRLHI